MKHEEAKDSVNRHTLEEWATWFFVSVGIIAITYGFFYLIDFLPEKPDTSEDTSVETVTTDSDEPQTASTTDTDIENIDALPNTIIFDTLHKELKILNPESNSIAALDTALLSGIVHHPDSANFANVGTIFLLGHSSYLPVVHNKNFQAFNDIQKLSYGDTIRLRSSDREYIYSVDRVYEAKAADASVPIEWGKPKLVLATCNSFGTKDDRFIVEASFVESHPFPS